MKECYENDEVKKEASMSEQTKQSEVKGKSENKEQEALKNTVIAWTGQEQLLISLFKKISENEKKMKEMSMVLIWLVKGYGKVLQKSWEILWN